MFFKAADKRARSPTCVIEACCSPHALRAQLSALLALRHCVALLRVAELVHPHDGDQGRPARRKRADTWHPETIKHGVRRLAAQQHRLGVVAKPLLGTPLPLWRCENGHLTCVASRAELGELAGRDLSDLDPHRPYVDEITFACDECGEPTSRVPEVIDGWYDSGAMPFAQFGYPHLDGEEFAKSYPADFIAEAIDQTRGWFYTLMAVGTLVFDRSSYRTVLCLGHILAEDGRKMSKHLGNILEPIALMDKHSADALRWYMLAGGSPWAARRIGDEVLEDVVRKVLLTYWNTTAFFVLYANASAWMPGTAPVPDVSSDPCSIGGRSPNCTPPCSKSTQLWRTSIPLERAAASRGSSTTCRTGTSGDRVADSGTATSPRSRPCTNASRC